MGVTEGVSSDGCSGPTIYTPAHINSEIFEFLRSSKDTPSVSHSLDSSLREGAGNGCGGLHHSSGCSLKSGGAGDFHRPYETLMILAFTIHRGTLPQSRIRSTAPSGREPGWGLHHSTGCSLKSGGAGDFHRPYESSDFFTLHHSSGDTPSVSHSLDSSLREGAGNGCGGLHHSSGCSLKSGGAGDFHRPYETQKS